MIDEKYAVIFTTKRKQPVPDSYSVTAKKIAALAADQKGFLGVETVTDSQGNGMSVSYWESLDDIRAWKENKIHLAAQARGKSEWYDDYTVRICKVIKEYGKSNGSPA